MKSKEDEIKEIFLAETQEQIEELNKLFTELEKNHANKRAVNAIFRITHTLKANAAGMGFEDIAGMAHVLEDIFSEIKSGRLSISTALFNDLFRANDTLTGMIGSINRPEAPVKFRGIKTKLEVVLRNIRADQPTVEASPVIAPATEFTPEVTPVAQVHDPEKAHHTEPVPITTVPEWSFVPELMAGSGAAAPLAEAQDAEVAVLEEAPEETENKITFSDNIHIPIRKLDNLLDLVGELIIERDRMMALYIDQGRSRNNEFARLQRITSELQYSVMDVRLVQVDVLFTKFHRIVRDVATLEAKKVNLVLEGTDNEIDRTILQIISDSLVHLVRNAVSHGIESAEVRQKAGKPATGTVTLSARSEKDVVILEVADDGKGIDAGIIRRKALEKGLITRELAQRMHEDEIIGLIFEPGFSSAEQVTAVSGRGVGMDVVKRALDSIGGLISVQSAVGAGTTVRLQLPSSMAVKATLLFELGTNTFAIPLSYTKAVISITRQGIHKVGNGLMASHLGKNIAIVFLNDLFRLPDAAATLSEGQLHQTFNSLPPNTKLNIVVISFNNREIGFVVDKLLQQKEIVEKPLRSPLENVKFISGATILGNGSVCLVLDPPSIMQFLFKNIKIIK